MQQFPFALAVGLVAGLSGGMLSAVPASAVDSLITPSAPDVFSVNQKVLSQMARQALHLPPDRHLVLKNPPVSFRDYGDPPTGGRVTVESADPTSGIIHLAVEVKNGETVSEVLYFDAMAVRGSASKGESSGGQGEVIQTLVRSGDEVLIVARGAGFEITLPGIAQNDGGMGDLVTVVNARSGARLRGEVSGADRIVVGMDGVREGRARVGLLESGSGNGLR